MEDSAFSSAASLRVGRGFVGGGGFGFGVIVELFVLLPWFWQGGLAT